MFQFPEQLDRLVFGAAEGFLHLPDGVDDIHPPLLVHPAVLDRQAHAVEQDSVQRPGICGELPETTVLKQRLGNTEVGKQFARLPIEVVERHLVCPRIFNSKHFFMCKTSLILIFGQKKKRTFGWKVRYVRKR